MLRLSRRNALSISAATALLVGCSILQRPQDGIPPAGAVRMLPDAVQHVMRASGEVQYFSDFTSGTLTEFDYPRSETSIGQITGVSNANGECTSGDRTFWVVASGANQVEEFKAGGEKPIATRSVKDGEPSGCAIDVATGDLAVTVLTNGDVVIFKPGKKSGTVLSTGLAEAFFDGYDAKGNLFADGLTSGDASQLVELPKGKNTFENISISRPPGGSVQWDGAFVTIGGGTAIYRYRITGKKAILKGTVMLNGSSNCVQTWIVKSLVFCADAGNEEGLVYKYPAGGSAIATLSGPFELPAGVVSLRAR